jgi:hypothetical protein
LPAGFVPTENLRFREESLTFKVAEQDTKEEEVKKFLRYQYPAMKKTQVSGTAAGVSGTAAGICRPWWGESVCGSVKHSTVATAVPRPAARLWL